MPDTFNAAQIILAQADRLKDKTALIYSDKTMSYGEFANLVNRAANAFAALGIVRGARVGLMVMDSPLYCAAFLGLVKAGAVAIPLNPRLPESDYGFILTSAALQLVVSDREHMSVLTKAAAGGSTSILCTSGESKSFEP